VIGVIDDAAMPRGLLVQLNFLGCSAM
jgi:hypothetical protein